MTVKYQIEYLNKEGEYEYIDVEFNVESRVENQAFDFAGTHCTHGKSGTFRSNDYLVIEDIIWDEDKHSEEENQEIKKWIKVDNNIRSLENLLENINL